MVSHDIEFCAKYAHRCALFFDGAIVTQGTPKEFFSGNSFYTTSANRMARHLLPEAVTAEDIIDACGGIALSEPDEEYYEEDMDDSEQNLTKEQKEEKKLLSGTVRAATALVSFIVLAVTAYRGFPEISRLAWAGLTGNGDLINFNSVEDQRQYTILILLFTVSATIFFLSVFQRGNAPPQSVLQVPKDRRRISKRTAAAAFLILLLIPLTIFIGVFYLRDRKYYFISLLIILETMIPFVMIFEERRPQARELVIIAVLCALGVAGRGAFFMRP